MGQLQDAIRQIDGSGKIVATISPEDVRKAGAKSKSGLLAKALRNGELIIAVTVQTFPYALDEIRADSGLKGKRFAVIADEAHSSQSGQISSKLKQVLTAEEIKEIEDGGSVDVESILASEMAERAESQNISYLAFTATPKNKTMELFGRKGSDGKPREFHLYSMKQAIEEGYILDVLKGYQSYDTALKIAGKAESGGGEVEESAARKGLMRWVQLHPTNISQKVQIIVEHFHANVAHLLEGKAKAMVVTDSRKAAVKYKKAIDAYIAKRAAEDASYNYRTLVAFSGSVSMTENEKWSQDWGPPPSKDDEFTEATMNPGAGADLAAAFKGDTYKIMLVANKFQTGFDQPASSTASGQGSAVRITASCTNSAGTVTKQSVTVSVDPSVPKVTVTGVRNGNVYALGYVPAAGCRTTGGLSGISVKATVKITPAVTNVPGRYKATCSGGVTGAGMPQDTTPVFATYEVAHGFDGFVTPRARAAVSPAIHLLRAEFRLTGSNRKPLPARTAAALARAGRVEATLAGPGIRAVTARCSWNSAHGYFQCAIAVPANVRTGHSTYSITASERIGRITVASPTVGRAANPLRIKFS